MELKNNCDELYAEVKRLHKENLLLKLEKEKIWKNIKTLIAGVSHEFKTPLNSILGFGELLEYRTSDKTIIKYSKNIQKSSKYMLSLVQNIIDITISEYKKLELSYSIFKPKEVIEETIQTFYQNEINYTLVDIVLSADYMRFKQLIYNLVSNAVKFNKKNYPINIITYIENNRFYFEITDYGEGIEEKNYHKIFELYSEFSKDFKKRRLGSGIGLSLCKAIVHAHKGEIGVTSKIYEGSTFYFYLPLNNI